MWFEFLVMSSFSPSNDKNLCSKALLSGVKALNKNDLEAEASTSSQGFNAQQSVKTFMPPHISPQVSSTIQKRSFTPVQPQSQQRPELAVEKGEPRICVFLLQKQEITWHTPSWCNNLQHIPSKHSPRLPTPSIFPVFFPSLQTQM